MHFDLRSSLFAAIVVAIAAISSMRIGGYAFVGVAGLVVALVVGLFALFVRSSRELVLPPWLGRWGLVLGVVLASMVPRIVRGVEPVPHSVAHFVVSMLVLAVVLRKRTPIFADAHPVLALAALVLPCQAACWDGIAYPEPDSAAYCVVPWVALALFALMGATVTRSTAFLERRFGVVLLALLALGGGVRILAVIASPDPVVDVWSWRRDAPRHLLRGVNPYGAEYEDVYASRRGGPHGLFNPNSPGTTRDLPTYPPLPIAMSLPFAALDLDVRFADALCDVIAAGLLAVAGFTLRNRAVGAIAAGIYLGYPLAARVIEQSWYEPMLAALIGGGLVLLARGYRIGGFVLGLGLVGKQFGAVLAPASARACRRTGTSWTIGLALAALLSLGTFLLWDARWFLDIILFNHMKMGPRLDSLTVSSLCFNEFGALPPSWLLWGLMLLACGLIAWKTPACPIAGAAGIGLSLLAFCLFNLQANFNYFYLCDYLLLLGIVGFSAAQPPPASARNSPPVSR